MISNYDRLISFARITEEAERYEETKKYIDEIVQTKKDDLTNEERDLLSIAYKGCIMGRRDGLKSINEFEATERNSNSKFINLVLEFKSILEKELNEYCCRLITIIDEYLLKKEISDESKVFYIKLKADYYKYLSEFYINDKKQEAINNSLKCYNEAYEIAKKLPWTNAIRLSLILNFGTFYYEVKNDPKKADEIASEVFDVAINQLDKIDDSEYKDSTTVLQLMKENIDMWRKEVENNGEKNDK